MVLVLSGCGSTMTPKSTEIPDIAQPTNRPYRNLTGFNDAMICMDQLLASTPRLAEPVYITSHGIPDDTGKLKLSSGRHMLVSSFSTINSQSDRFRFIDLPALQYGTEAVQRAEDIEALLKHIQIVLGGGDMPYPDYYVMGSISQLDENVTSTSKGISIVFGDVFDAGAGSDVISSIVTLDMNLVNAQEREVINGLTSTNSMTVSRQGMAGDLGGRIKKAGLTFNLSLDKNEGMHQAVRNLVQLGTIELLGKLAQVPYWRCLSIESTNPEMMSQARSWYADKTPRQLTEFAQRMLARKTHEGQSWYSGPFTGILDYQTRDSISRYQTAHNLIPNGVADFDLYRTLISDELALGRIPDSPEPPREPVTHAPIQLALGTKDGKATRYRLNDTLTLQLGTNVDAHAYCYYEGGNGEIRRIFPNEFQPNSFMPAGQSVTIPGPEHPFSLVLDWPHVTETIWCLATDREITSQLPKRVLAPDMRPLRARSLQQVRDDFNHLNLNNFITNELLIQVGQ